ncbi:MAG TPA: alpha-glucosidase C-terminal domain-containing protein [Bacteroidota bacterium]|nr:alpha-glucosidase C-terminal domain-containing protein [Bacteroidota bacterium]
MNTPAHPQALAALEEALLRTQRSRPRGASRYRVPALWRSPQGRGAASDVDPFDYYIESVRTAMSFAPPERGSSAGAGEWTREAVIYNMFVRTTCAFDHDGNGTLDLPLNAAGFRETGTFLKAIAMLPYIRRLGANTVHLLPITSIGQDGNKGTLGSPYAIRNPYEIDEALAEPLFGLDAKTEFRAFVEAAHLTGIRVVVEFVFRTAAKDADWVKEHPEWMYWIRESIQMRDPAHPDESRYGSPLFTPEELEQIHRDVKEGRLGNLIPPHEVYRHFFTQPPDSPAVAKEGGRYLGRLADGTRVRIPGAFADWPPDDNQPPWGDVTYLRMYTHPAFNYIGYNTIRMYDTRLTGPEHVNRPLWDRIVGIVPYYQDQFGIDGVMIDMGHALPMSLKEEMVRAARTKNPDFAFWDENFAITQRSREEGYNAVFGYLWVDEHHPEKMARFYERLATEGFPIPFFATPENHNTPRAASRPGGPAYARWAMVMNAFIPAVPFIHSGYELAETYPINTGLDFTVEQIRSLPSERLPLFSEYAYDWLSTREFTPLITRVLALRDRYRALVVDRSPGTFRVLRPDAPSVLAYARVGAQGTPRLAVAGNADFHAPAALRLSLGARAESLTELLGGGTLQVKEGVLEATLGPGECLIVEY